MDSVYVEAQSLQEQIVSWRRMLHQIPETGLELPNTLQFVKDCLSEMGLSFTEYQGYSGLTVCIGNGNGRTVALRADMDALAIKEETGLSYASHNDNMHACGHDAHTAMLLGVAKLLKARESSIQGTVKLIFQPGEEGPGGARLMVEDGVMKGVDGIYALHVGNLSDGAKPGTVAVSLGPVTAADDQVIIQVTGVGGHGSSPHTCVDPVAVSALIINNIQYIVSREVDPQCPCVVTLASVNAGRETFNVIPEQATIRGTIRNASPSTRDYVLKRIREIAVNTANMMRATCTVDFVDGYPALINDHSMAQSFIATAKHLLGDSEVFEMTHGIMGGEDAAFFYREVPGCFFFLDSSAPCPVDGNRYGAHHPKFCLDESVFWRGTGLLSQAALDFLH